MDIEAKVGNIIRDLRKQQSLTLEDVADSAASKGVAIDAPALSRFERGKQGLFIVTFCAIAAALSVPAWQILAAAEGDVLAGQLTRSGRPLRRLIQALAESKEEGRITDDHILSLAEVFNPKTTTPRTAMPTTLSEVRDAREKKIARPSKKR